MRKINARRLLQFSTNQLFDILTSRFIIVFEDGIEIETNAHETIFSSFAWDFHRQWNQTPLLSKHHVSSVVKNNRFGSNTHKELLGICYWAVYDHYMTNGLVNLNDELQFRDVLSKRTYELTNEIYNVLTEKAEKHVVSLDITDLIQIINIPEIKQVNNTVISEQSSLDNNYKVITNNLLHNETLSKNPLAIASRSKLINMNQALQCLGPRGFLTDTDSVIFPVAILRGYVQGLRSFYDSFIESRSSAKSLMFSKTPLQQAEYFSRRLQLMTQIVQNLHMGDCGSTNYLLWNVQDAQYVNGKLKRKADLPNLAGKRYMDNDGILKTINVNDKHLIGRTLKLRSVTNCNHEDPYGVCSTCFGDLAYSVPANTNIGQMCCTSLAQKSSQNVLSVKHFDGSSVVDGIQLDDYKRKFLKTASDENSYLLSDSLKGQKIKLVISQEEAMNIGDIYEVSDVHDLNITRVSEITDIGIIVNGEIETFNVNINQRYASMTYALLAHIKRSGWELSEYKIAGKNKLNYVINMDDWDWSKEILSLPLRHYNMSDHSASIAGMLESSISMLQERDNSTSPNSALVELFNIVNTKLNVNLAVLDVVLYATMVVSSIDDNFALPKGNTKKGLGVMKYTIANRSLSAAMAYEEHRKIILSPRSYIIKNRVNHIFDDLLMPCK